MQRPLGLGQRERKLGPYRDKLGGERPGLSQHQGRPVPQALLPFRPSDEVAAAQHASESRGVFDLDQGAYARSHDLKEGGSYRKGKKR